MKEHVPVLAQILRETRQLAESQNCEVSQREVVALEWAIAALEAAEAREAELREELKVSHIDKSFYELAIKERDYERVKCDRLTAEVAELRARVAELESQVPKWVYQLESISGGIAHESPHVDGWIKTMLAELQAALPAAPKEEV